MSSTSNHHYSHWAHWDKTGFLLTLKLTLAHRIHHVWNRRADDKFTPFPSCICNRNDKTKGIHWAKEDENRQRRATMQSFIRTCCAFECDVEHAHLWGSSALGRFKITLISTNTEEWVSEERSVLIHLKQYVKYRLHSLYCSTLYFKHWKHVERPHFLGSVLL